MLDVAKEFGYKVRHLKMKDLNWAFSYPAKKLILINRKIKYTLVGSACLGHEIGHLIDLEDGRYLDYFYPKKGISESLIKKAEWAAAMFAKKLIEDRGISTKNIPDFDKKHFEEFLMPQWLEIYSKLV